MMRRRRGQGADPRDLGAGTRSGRLARFRRGQPATPQTPAAAEDGGGGCCLWPFMVMVMATVFGAVMLARATTRSRPRFSA